MIASSATLLQTQLPIALTATDAVRVVLYSVPYTAVEGDEVMVHGRFQVSNPLTINVMVGHYILRAADPTATVGTTVARAVTENVTPDGHHMPRERLKFDRPVAGAGFYNLVAYAAADLAAPTDVLTVDDYGELEAMTARWVS